MYLAVALAPVLLAVLAVGAFTLWVDPFGIYRVFAARAGVNQNRPRELGHERVVRAFMVRRLKPDALVLGTSRAQVGLDPETLTALGVAQRPVNVAFSDGTPYEALRYVQHANALGQVKLAVFAADYLSFLGATKGSPDFSEGRLAVGPTGKAQRLHFLDDVPSAVLSLDALRISRRTLLEQAEPSYFFDRGRRRPDTMAARIVEQGGAHQACLWSERDYASSYACADPRRLATHLADFTALARYCREHGVRLVVLSSPSHVRSNVLVAEAGLGGDAEAFRRAVAKVVFEHGGELWEFSGADPRTTAEPLPASTDAAARLRWYWESSHYNRELGDVVLKRIFGGDAGELSDWGERVTPQTLEASLARVRAELDAWKTAHPDEVAELRELVAEAKQAPDSRRKP